ncbi:MAG: MFS transporter [Desulfobacterales bacterium]
MGMIGCLTAGLINGALFTLGPVFGHQIGLSVPGISLFMGATVLGGLVLQWPVGLLSDHFDRNVVMAGLGLAVAFISLAIALLMRESFFLLITLTILYGGVAFTLYPVAVAHTHDFFPPDDIVAVSSALLLSFGLGASIGPPAAAMVMKLIGTLCLHCRRQQRLRRQRGGLPAPETGAAGSGLPGALHGHSHVLPGDRRPRPARGSPASLRRVINSGRLRLSVPPLTCSPGPA